MPKIFKQNKLALASANILMIVIWIPISSLISDLITYQDAPFYLYKLGDLIKIIPPIWITYYLWIKRKGFK